MKAILSQETLSPSTLVWLLQAARHSSYRSRGAQSSSVAGVQQGAISQTLRSAEVLPDQADFTGAMLTRVNFTNANPAGATLAPVATLPPSTQAIDRYAFMGPGGVSGAR